MAKLSVIYYSGYGHTEVIAKAVHRGAESVKGIHPTLLKVDPQGALEKGALEHLEHANAMIFGTPTYMGSAAGPFKLFMDSTVKLWFAQKWKNKLAGGFTNSAGLSGDKLCTLTQLAVFAAQHGMMWVGNAIISATHELDDVNRLGSFLGMMAQSENAPPEVTPSKGDILTGEQYGQRVAEMALRWAQTV